MHGPWSFSFAYYPSEEAVHEQAERYRHPFMTIAGSAETGELRSHAGPALDGDESVVLTSLRQRRGAPEARIVNESAEHRTVRFHGQELELRPWEIRTVRL